MNVLLTVVGIGLIILVHELGHLLAAKWVGILAYEFSIGFGPQLLSRKWGETTYSLRLLPLGGYVRLAGMDDDKEQTEPVPPERNFYHKGFWQRLLVLVAGSAMNVLSGFVLFVVVYSLLGISEVSPVIEGVYPNSVAARIGIVASDALIAVDQVDAQKDIKAAVNYIHSHAGKPITVRWSGAQGEKSMVVEPQLDAKSGQGLIGIQLKAVVRHVNPLHALGLGLKETVYQTAQTLAAISKLITGKVSVDQMLGPVGIVQVVDYQLQRAVVYFLNLMGIITVNIGILNLFPFPALDGGHILLLVIERIRGRVLSKRMETVINTFGMAMLMALMAFVLFNDVSQWGHRKKFFKELRQGSSEKQPEATGQP